MQSMDADAEQLKLSCIKHVEETTGHFLETLNVLLMHHSFSTFNHVPGEIKQHICKKCTYVFIIPASEDYTSSLETFQISTNRKDDKHIAINQYDICTFLCAK